MAKQAVYKNGFIAYDVNMFAPMDACQHLMWSSPTGMLISASIINFMRCYFLPMLTLFFLAAMIPQAIAQEAFVEEMDTLYFSRDLPGNLEESIAAMEKALQEKKDGEILWRLARGYRWMARVAVDSLQKTRYYQRAKVIAKQAIASDGKNPNAHLWYGIITGEMAEDKSLLEALPAANVVQNEMTLVMILDPKNPAPFLALGVIYRRLPFFLGGSNDKSIRYLKKAIQYGPDLLRSYLELAKTYIAMGNRVEAVKTLKELLSVQAPYDPVEARIYSDEAERLLQQWDKSQ